VCICLVGAEAIVGTLAANKALTTSQSAVLGMAASPVQALDMLTRPTPTSSCRTHFVGLAGCMRLNGCGGRAEGVEIAP